MRRRRAVAKVACTLSADETRARPHVARLLRPPTAGFASAAEHVLHYNIILRGSPRVRLNVVIKHSRCHRRQSRHRRLSARSTRPRGIFFLLIFFFLFRPRRRPAEGRWLLRICLPLYSRDAAGESFANGFYAFTHCKRNIMNR